MALMPAYGGILPDYDSVDSSSYTDGLQTGYI